eukprot:5905426-Amphidinium_carterae.1
MERGSVLLTRMIYSREAFSANSVDGGRQTLRIKVGSTAKRAVTSSASVMLMFGGERHVLVRTRDPARAELLPVGCDTSSRDCLTSLVGTKMLVGSDLLLIRTFHTMTTSRIMS